MEQAEISEYFQDFTELCPQHLIPVWTREIEYAEAMRQEDVKSMDYMNPKVEKREYPFALSHFLFESIRS